MWFYTKSVKINKKMVSKVTNEVKMVLPPRPTFFKNLSVFWQNMLVKFDPMLSVNLEYFIIKNEMQNSINIQSCRNQTFTGDDDF